MFGRPIMGGQAGVTAADSAADLFTGNWDGLWADVQNSQPSMGQAGSVGMMFV